MDEQTIFSGKDASYGGQTPPKPAAPVPAPPTLTPNIPPAQPPPATGGLYKEYARSGPPMFFGANILTFVKIIIGLLVFLFVGFLLFRFIMPMFMMQSKEKVTLAYWGLWEDSQTMQAVINDFQKEQPTIEVIYTKHDIKQQYRERLLARTQTELGPDIFQFHNTWVSQLSSLLLPLPTNVMSKETLQTDYFPVVQQDLVRNGALYGVPLGIDTIALFVNTDILEASGGTIPQTWNDFDKAARMLTVKDETGAIKTAGAALGTFDNITHAPDIISLLLIQNGADMRNLASTKQNAIDAFDFYTAFAKGDANVWDDTLEPSVLSFAKGNLAMYFGYSWDIFTIQALNPQLKFVVTSVPHLPDREITVASYWAEGISTATRNQKEAFTFLQFLAKKEIAQKLFTEESKKRLFGQPYARVDLAETLKDNAVVYPFVSLAKNAKSSFFASDTFDNGLNTQMNSYLGNAIRAILGNTSTQTAVDTLAQGIAQVLAQYEGR